MCIETLNIGCVAMIPGLSIIGNYEIRQRFPSSDVEVFGLQGQVSTLLSENNSKDYKMLMLAT